MAVERLVPQHGQHSEGDYEDGECSIERQVGGTGRGCPPQAPPQSQNGCPYGPSAEGDGSEFVEYGGYAILLDGSEL
ncbi:MAG: hypothetical protein Q8P59_10035 [Dehalococcoidia bacterium]|nr:hypothetical protein [Dehalococcoidia bacterium]